MSTVNRRDALKVMVAAGATAAVACAQPSSSSSSAEARDVVKRTHALVGPPWPTLDPFLFCVHHDDAYPAGNERFGPVASLAGRRIGMDFDGKDGWNMYHGDVVPGFPAHPHRGFETVTVVRRGLLDHADSLGAAARYGGGDVQWLTAGKGIQHAEMFPLLEQSGPNPVELFQLWLNLPAADKFAEPHFSMLWNETIPRRAFTDESGRVSELTLFAGRIHDVTAPRPPPRSWAAREESDVAIFTLRMEPGARFSLPPARSGTNRMLYLFDGKELHIGPRRLARGHAAELEADHEAPLTAGSEEVELLVLQGRPIGEPVARRGPFVMNTSAEIEQAFYDYRRTRFGGWPWPSEDPVHGREGRFARHKDGKVERPT